MKKLSFIILCLITLSCQQEKEASIENINQIYATKDFSIEYKMSDDDLIRMSFREDYMTYVINGETNRKTVEYKEVLWINEFVAQQFQLHDATREDIPSIIIYDDTRKVTLKVPQYASKLRQLINKLKI